MSWRIMVVEDDPLTRALISGQLTDRASKVTEFDAAVPALTELLANPYDLLITDLGLSGEETGLWLLNRAREDLADLPIIVITGSSPDRRQVRAADAVVLKPFHPDELLGEVLELLAT